MSTNAAVRTAWADNVFNATAFQYVPAYAYPVDYGSTETAPDKGRNTNNGKVDFFQYLVSSSEVPQVSKRNNLKFVVEVIRTIEDDPNGTNYQTLIDDFRTVIDRVNDNLGLSWDSTVDLFIEPSDPPVASIDDWGGVPVWVGVMTFEAIKEIAA